MSQDTIVAIATPPGRGGVGMVRLSGPLAYSIALRITGKSEFLPRQASFSLFKEQQTGEVLDEGLTLYFKAPHSFTGEDVVELHGHGSPIVLDQLVKTCLFYGARLAKPGEFSERAFLNNKLDLAQAEAIADLIHANSITAARMAMRSLQGAFSARIQQLTEELISLRQYVEAAIDFPDEEIDFLNDGHIATRLQQLIGKVLAIRHQANQGTMIREGLLVVIVGKPNVGKSTLMNQLAARDVAIVTDIAGTTRDVVRQDVLIDDLVIQLVDTAGLRESDDLIEQEGIRRAWQEIRQAQAVLWLKEQEDDSRTFYESSPKELQQTLSADVPIIEVINKIDRWGIKPQVKDNRVFISAKEGQGLSLLKDKMKEVVGFQPTEGLFLARRRHLLALDEALRYLQYGDQQLRLYQAGELLADDLRCAQHALSEITGEFSADDLLGKIFSSFCIGK